MKESTSELLERFLKEINLEIVSFDGEMVELKGKKEDLEKFRDSKKEES